ncbi:WecB/TagA/CpsF family glycosyltransferase [Flavobacterium sp.]|uniref:WecB/TagA/CpsF family glycosyltransferase n=1 Tax=Flavobacterium sp. TaxID=239 RepID=UPI0037534944
MSIIYTWNYPVFKGDLHEIKYENQQHFLINTISPNSYGLAVKYPEVKKALQQSDVLILDGLYFGWAALFKQGIRINRIAGWDAFVFFSQELNKNKGKVFFLGSTQETLLKIKERYNIEYPNVEVGFYSPPFKQEFSNEDNVQMHNQVNAFKADIVFVGMTAPKQELWSYQNRKDLEVHLICSIGNVFDWYAGNSKRPGIFWQKTGMEWLVRIFLRPEVFRRNIGNQLLFFWHLALETLKIKRYD